MDDTTVFTAKGLEAMARGFQRSAVVLAAVELGVFTALSNGSATARGTAKLINADPRGTDRLLRALAHLGLVESTETGFRNTPVSERFLSEASPEFMAHFKHQANVYRSWGTLAQAVKAGGAVHERSQSPEATRDFIAAMHFRAQYVADQCAAGLGLTGVDRVLDVGGGSGAFSMAFCRARPELSATLLDLDHVLDLAREYVAAESLEQRISFLPGVYHTTDFGQDFDLVFFSAIVHINSPEQNQALLKKAHDALRPGGRVAVRDFIMDEERMKPERGVLFALNMLVNTPGGDSYTEAELRDWMAGAGFEDMELVETDPGATTLVGKRIY